MSRKFIAAVLAVATTIATLSAAPAKAASEEDIARLLAGAATVFIIGKAIQTARDRDRDDNKDAITRHRPKPQITRSQSYPKVMPRGQVSGRHKAALPERCVRQIKGGRVNRVVMGRCLERNNVRLRALPRACGMTVQTRRGRAPAYALPCLRHKGYSLARH